jgi:hypothetical protein
MNTQEIISNEQISSLERIAAIIAKSGMGGFKTPEQATVALLLALAEGIPLGRVIHEYHVINGRLSLRSECMLARFQKAGGAVEYLVHNDTEVSLTASHPKGGALTVVWTIERARKAGLTSNPTWTKHPAAMLTARATAEAVRAVYPACLSGIITEDEAVEITTPPAHNGNGAGSLPIADFVARHGNGAHPLPGELTAAPAPEPAPEPAPRDYVISERPQKQWTRRRKGERSPAFVIPQQDPAILTQEIDRRIAEVMAEPAPAPQAEAEFTVVPESESKRPSPNVAALWHPLDEHLAGLDQDKLTAFLLKQAFITEGQNYKWCGPNATSRILKQLPSFLKAAGLEAVTA